MKIFRKLFTLSGVTIVCSTIFGILTVTPLWAYETTPETSSDIPPNQWLNWKDYESQNALWLNPGMVSYHFQSEKGYNNGNWGFGAEYRFANVASVTAGRFYNSDRAYSNYAGVYWQPIGIGPFNFGLVAGGFNGYPQTNNSGWFAAAMPALTYESKWVGGNLFIIPTVGDRVHGALSLQLKLKVWD